MCGILCYGPRFENNLEVLYGKHAKITKKREDIRAIYTRKNKTRLK